MATFQIHEDLANPADQKDIKGRLATKGGKENQQRQTFAVLNNIAHGKPHAQSTILQQQKDGNAIGGKTFGGKINDENEMPLQNSTILQGTTAAAANKKATVRVAVPVDQFKAFYVDGSVSTVAATSAEPSSHFSKDTVNDDECDDKDTSKADCSMAEMRQPLQELHNELLETPVSIGNVLSPMSVDKSTTSMDNTCDISLKSERERLFYVEEYQMDVLAYLRELETKHLPKYGYMRKQQDINYSMRTILIDWLVEVCEEYRLQSETLCLAVSYIDRFLSIMSVVRAKLQLVGTAAMFIASKYEEIYPPDVGEFVYITDNTYTKSQVLRMEQFILKALTFDLSVPSTYTFIHLYSIMIGFSDQLRCLATYISELSLLEAEPYLQYPPSKISAAAIVLASYNLGEPMWSSKFESIFNCKLDSLKEIVFHLNKTHLNAVNAPQQAIQEKYKSDKYLQVSMLNAAKLNEETFAMIEKNFQQNDDETAATTDNNENVRKMISSLIFV